MAKIGRPLGLSLLFLLLLAIGLLVQPPTAYPLYDPASNGPDGLLLLAEWLDEMGYPVDTTGTDSFDLNQTDLLFVYPGEGRFTRAEGDRLVDWVEGGGTLVLVDTRDAELLNVFDFSLTGGRSTDRLTQFQPLLPEASPAITGTKFARRLRLPDDSRFVTLLAEDTTQARSAAAVLGQGLGWVWLLSEDFTLTNQRLTVSRSSAQIVPALLRAVPDGGLIRFDTYHVRESTEPEPGQIGSLQEWAYTTPTGWATLFLFGLGVLFLLLQGRRLGPPLQTVTQGRRREAAEFVVAMAGLQRRARVRDSVARHHIQRLKERLGRPWQIPADLPDSLFLARLAEANPEMDNQRIASLRSLLADLSAAPDEARLVVLIQQAEEVASSRWQVASSRWQVAGGRWQVAGGRWQVAGGK